MSGEHASSKHIITQQRQLDKYRLPLQTSLLTGNVGKKVPSEEIVKYHLAKCLHCGTRQPSLLSPYHTFSSIRGWKNLFATCLGFGRGRPQRGQGQRGPGLWDQAPRIPGLTYHPGHCDDCSFFSPKCSETCDSGWLASAW